MNCTRQATHEDFKAETTDKESAWELIPTMVENQKWGNEEDNKVNDDAYKDKEEGKKPSNKKLNEVISWYHFIH